MLFYLILVQIFEVGDVVLLDGTKDVGAVNRRHLAALYCGANSGFEVQMYHICSSYIGSLSVLQHLLGDRRGCERAI